MNFILQQPLMTLGGAGDGTSFAADIFFGRPAFCDVQKFEGRMASYKREIVALTQRKNNKLASLDFILDTQGLFLIAVFREPLILGNAKLALGHLLRVFEVEQHRSVQRTLRPFDDLDRLRVQEMRTVGDLRPYEEESSDVEEESGEKEGFATQQFLDDEYFNLWCRGRKKLTREEVLAIEFEVEVPRRNLLEGRTLALQDVGDDLALANDSPQTLAALARWIASAQELAAISLLSIGTAELYYFRCLYEPRRRALLKWGLRALPSLPEIVERGLELAERGALPAPHLTAGIKHTFLRRCEEVLKGLSPGLETTRAERRRVAVLLGASPTCDLCTSAKSVHCYEWDPSHHCWTRFGVFDPMPLIYKPVFEPGPEPPLPDGSSERSLCTACADKYPYSCQSCRSCENLVGDTLDCRCGGVAAGRAPRGKPPSLAVELQLFCEKFRCLSVRERSCVSAEELREERDERRGQKRMV